MIRIRPVFEMDGVAVGHWTDRVAGTGCTVARLTGTSVSSGEVRGGAPATREFTLLDPLRMIERLDAVVLTGGSAFGLAAADGVMAHLEEAGVGHVTKSARVPIVVAMALFDLGSGDPGVRPDANAGRAAAAAAAPGPALLGAVGAGTGCTVAKWAGEKHRRPGGLGGATVGDGSVRVAALVAVNPVGDLVERAWPLLAEHGLSSDPEGEESTTIGLLVTDARLDKRGCHLLSQSGHDGLARVIAPVHTQGDGDAFVATAMGRVDAPLEQVRLLGGLAVSAAVRVALGDDAPERLIDRYGAR